MGDAEEKKDETPAEERGLSRLNSFGDKVLDVTDKAIHLLNAVKEQKDNKIPTKATKKTIDGILIDTKLTTDEGLSFRAKMIGSLVVKFHHGDDMAVRAIQDLKIAAKNSGRHKPRIVIKISTNGIEIYEDKTMKLIMKHELEKISYLTQDPIDNKVFAYIHNKFRPTSHKLWSIKSPKCAVIVSHMKTVFHYMHDKKRSNDRNKVTSPLKAPPVVPVVEASAPQKDDEKDEESDPLGFNYGKLLDFDDLENETATPVLLGSVPVNQVPDNLYSSMPRPGNRLGVGAFEEEEVVYSTVNKLRGQPKEEKVPESPDKPPPRPATPPTSALGIVNPAWASAANSENNSVVDDDIFAVDRYKQEDSSSSEEDDPIYTSPPPVKIPSSVFVDDYEWDIGEMRSKKYSEGHVALAETRERLSTITKNAVDSLERSKTENVMTASSLIDFGAFEDKPEADPVDLFDNLAIRQPADNRRSLHDDLLSIDFSSVTTKTEPTPNILVHSPNQPKPTQPTNYDINALINNPATYNNSNNTQTFGQHHGNTGLYSGYNSSSTLQTSGFTSLSYTANKQNYSAQQSFNFPVQFSPPINVERERDPMKSSGSTSQNKSNVIDAFDPFADLGSI